MKVHLLGSTILCIYKGKRKMTADDEEEMGRKEQRLRVITRALEKAFSLEEDTDRVLNPLDQPPSLDFDSLVGLQTPTTTHRPKVDSHAPHHRMTRRSSHQP